LAINRWRIEGGLAGSVGGCAESREITWPPPTKISTWVEAKTWGHLIKFGFKVKLKVKERNNNDLE
jgi:hypothetical protein